MNFYIFLFLSINSYICIIGADIRKQARGENLRENDPREFFRYEKKYISRYIYDLIE